MSDDQQTFHVGDTGSNPVGDATESRSSHDGLQLAHKAFPYRLLTESPQYHPKPCLTPAERVLDRSVRSDNGCLEWQGAASAAGYGRVRIGGRLYSPHRLVLEASVGRKLDADELACHRCDNPRCVDVGHLFVGSYADNAHDAMAKGRHVLPPAEYRWKKGESGFIRNRSK